MKFVSFVCNLQRAQNNWAFKFKGLYFVILAVITCNGFSDVCQYKNTKTDLNPPHFLHVCLQLFLEGVRVCVKENK